MYARAYTDTGFRCPFELNAVELGKIRNEIAVIQKENLKTYRQAVPSDRTDIHERAVWQAVFGKNDRHRATMDNPAPSCRWIKSLIGKATKKLPHFSLCNLCQVHDQRYLTKPNQAFKLSSSYL